MPGRITELSESQIIADLIADRKRLSRAVTAAQEPLWEWNTYTITGPSDTAHTLSYVPYGINAVALNGLVLTEGVDYTADYTTGIVTVSATLTAGDVLHVRYVTNGDLIAYSGPVNTGGITDTFNRTDSATSLGTTSDGNATWTALAGTWGISSNQAYCAVNGGIGVVNVAAVTSLLSDGTVQATLTTAYSSGIAFRIQDATNFWMVRIDGVTGSLDLYKTVSGTSSVVTHCGAGVSGDVLTAVFSGSSITVKQNGTTVSTATDATFVTAAQHGLVITTNSPLTARFDNWSLTP